MTHGPRNTRFCGTHAHAAPAHTRAHTDARTHVSELVASPHPKPSPLAIRLTTVGNLNQRGVVSETTGLGHSAASHNERQVVPRCTGARASDHVLVGDPHAHATPAHTRAHLHSHAALGARGAAPPIALVTRQQAYHRGDNLNQRGLTGITNLGHSAVVQVKRRIRPRGSGAWTSGQLVVWHTCARRARTSTRAQLHSQAVVGASAASPQPKPSPLAIKLTAMGTS